MIPLVVSILLVVTAFAWWRSSSIPRSAHGVPLPPGPPRDPLIGNLRIIPMKHTHRWFYQISKKYGKVFSLQIPGKTVIVLNSAKAAVDLLDKRSANYSDRPITTMMLLMGWLKTLVFFQYGEDFIKHRKLLHEFFNPVKSRTYESNQMIGARRLVGGLLKKPEDFSTQVNRFTAATVVRIIQGHEILTDEDPYIKILADTGHCIGNCSIPGNNPLDVFPILQYFPAWFPGTYTATQALEFRPIVDVCHDYPFDDVKRKMEQGAPMEESFLYTHIAGLEREGDKYPYSVDDIKGAAAVSYTAGSDTSWSTILMFILAMVVHPAEQAKAQEELDRVIGGDKLPQYEDRGSLPYMEGLLQETYRWHNAVPLGIPHLNMDDDVYDGMFIPKGSIIIANTHAMALDEDVYSNPHKFDPTRYLRGEPHLSSQYGFGRRICPGKHVADATVWLAAASIISAFTISPELDKEGKPVMPKLDFVSGVVCHPEPFKCTIRPRNKIAQTVAAQED